MQRIYAWCRGHPTLLDALLAAPLLLLALMELPNNGNGVPPVVRPLYLLVSLPVIGRRRWPVPMFLLGAGAGAAQLAVEAQVRPSDAALLILLYTVAVYADRRAGVAALAVCHGGACAVLVDALRWQQFGHDEWIFALVLLNAPVAVSWLLGVSIRTRRAYFAQLEERAARLEWERDTRAQIAAAAERARIARDLHDVVAHNVSIMVVQADGARCAFDQEPAQAGEALRTISATGREALAEMRRLLGVLRSSTEPGWYTPQPGVDQLTELVEQMRTTGLSVAFTVEGVPCPLPAATALAAYRIIQEALTNTLKHAGPLATAQVRLGYGEHALEVDVRDDGSQASDSLTPGHGMIGMRERVAMLGGRFHAGAGADGGFHVRATFPLVEPAALSP
jgi:signal transduction histidine kinase